MQHPHGFQILHHVVLSLNSNPVRVQVHVLDQARCRSELDTFLQVGKIGRRVQHFQPAWLICLVWAVAAVDCSDLALTVTPCASRRVRLQDRCCMLVQHMPAFPMSGGLHSVLPASNMPAWP